MKFTEAPIRGVFVVEPDRFEDERGFFERTWNMKEARAAGIVVEFTQTNISYNKKRGTLRGMHHQLPPHQEPKLVSCIAGKMYDVAVDIRPDSPTYLRHFAVELDSAKHNALFIPEGMAHGFQTLSDDTTVLYVMGNQYNVDASRGLRFDDPALSIRWPVDNPIVNARDRAFPLLQR